MVVTKPEGRGNCLGIGVENGGLGTKARGTNSQWIPRRKITYRLQRAGAELKKKRQKEVHEG